MSVILLGIIAFSCKKAEFSKDTAQSSSSPLEDSKKLSGDVETGAPCSSNFVVNMQAFISNWGIGSDNYNQQNQNIYFLTDRLNAHNAVYTAYQNCLDGSPNNNGPVDPPNRNKPFQYFMPPGTLSEWMTFLGATDLCDQNQINAIKAWIDPLNAYYKKNC